MASSSRTAVAMGIAAGLLLAVFQVELALSGAGPYRTMPAVKAGAIAGTMVSYVSILAALAFATSLVRGIRAQVPRRASIVGLALAAAAATLLSPLLPAGALALGCKTELLCPAAANPLSWAYLELVFRLPLAPAVVGALVVAVAAVLPVARRGE